MNCINKGKLSWIVNSNPLNNPFYVFRRLVKIPIFEPKSKDISVLFIDMARSVVMKMDYDEIWQANIHLLHERSKKIIKCCNGKISKTIGDCVMAYFCGPYHEQNAMWATFGLLETFRLLREFFQPDMDCSLFCFSVTIGMASGPAFFLYKNDPYGLPVDLAARLQGVAEPGSGVIFAQTLNSVKNTEVYNEIRKFIKEKEVIEIKSFGEVLINRFIIF